ncbi:MAG TPA: AbrB/MazE/SpoVT family DNA-binding domain-containing protein [Acidimicrobiales bacterium]|jgi:AbrB family looped-hinge helix DNA binding protein|nr:AbrB/MazE/SpoVT family DNA-binding domain-containing protein [Acidimicrobiales bacterium]
MTSRVGPKGQVVIPKVMRDRLGLRPGDEVEFALEGEAVRVSLAGTGLALRGRFAGAGLTEVLEADHRAERAR